MKTYLVTGVAGFIASRTAELLLSEGHRVVGIDNLNDYYDVRLKTHRLQKLLGGQSTCSLNPASSNINFIDDSELQNGDFHFYPIDIENLSLLEELFEKYQFDAVINLAARAGVRYSIENPHVYMTTNAHGSLNLLECMRAHKVDKFVLASTSSLYAGQEMPFIESLPVNQPISPYAASKKAAEAMAYSYHHLFNIDVSIVRYFTVFGPAGRPDMSPYRFIKWIHEGSPIKLYGDGSQSRDFTYVDDIALGTIAALKPTGYEVFNLGGGNNPISINQFIGMIESRLGKKAKIDYLPAHNADMHKTWADISKAKQHLNWTPNTSVEHGLDQTIEWYLGNLAKIKNIAV